MTPVTDTSVHASVTGDGTALVFLHGAWVSSRMWQPQIDRFADEYTVITVDFRGHGESGPTDRTKYSVDVFAEDIREVLEALGVTDPVLCGLSLGGIVAQAYSIRYQDVAGLILADTVRSVPPIPLARWQKRVFFPKLPLYSAIRTMGSDRWFRFLLCSVEGFYGRPWLALDKTARQYAYDEVAAIPDEEFVKIYDALYEFDPLPVTDIDAPTLLLTGDHEAPTVRAQNHVLESRIADATRVRIPDAGHLANLDNPTAFNQSIAGFLERVGA